MDARATDAIRSRLNTLSQKALARFKRQVSGIYSNGDYREFIPEFMVREAIRAAEDNALRLVADAVSQVSAISAAPDAYWMIDEAIAAHLLALESAVEQGRGVPLHSSGLKAAGERFDAVRQRSVRAIESHSSRFGETKNQGGRRQKWDWESAVIHATRVANLPQGLTTGRGRQAEIEGVIEQWFIQTTGEAPAVSEIRKRAKAVIKG